MSLRQIALGSQSICLRKFLLVVRLAVVINGMAQTLHGFGRHSRRPDARFLESAVGVGALTLRLGREELQDAIGGSQVGACAGLLTQNLAQRGTADQSIVPVHGIPFALDDRDKLVREVKSGARQALTVGVVSRVLKDCL